MLPALAGGQRGSYMLHLPRFNVTRGVRPATAPAPNHETWRDRVVEHETGDAYRVSETGATAPRLAPPVSPRPRAVSRLVPATRCTVVQPTDRDTRAHGMAATVRGRVAVGG